MNYVVHMTDLPFSVQTFGLWLWMWSSNNLADKLKTYHLKQMIFCFSVINMAWQWRHAILQDREAYTAPGTLADSGFGWASLSHGDSAKMQDMIEHMDETAPADAYIGSKIILSPHGLDSYEYKVDWIRTGNYAVLLSKPWLDRGDNLLQSIMCKPVRVRVFIPHVTLNEHGFAKMCLTSAFSGEEICSQMVVPDETWENALRQFTQTFVRMGIPCPEIRAIQLQKHGEVIDLDDIIEPDVDLSNECRKRQRVEEP